MREANMRVGEYVSWNAETKQSQDKRIGIETIHIYTNGSTLCLSFCRSGKDFWLESIQTLI